MGLYEHDPVQVSFYRYLNLMSRQTHKIFAFSRVCMTCSPGTKSGSVKGPARDMIVSKYFLQLVSPDWRPLAQDGLPSCAPTSRVCSGARQVCGSSSHVRVCWMVLGLEHLDDG